jgi:O-acetyl-ADP-ribose deacetylase (regulator of RNase III)
VEPLRIIKRDATSPQASGPKTIAHICNDLGGWGKGFVVAVSRRWPSLNASTDGGTGTAPTTTSASAPFSSSASAPDIWVANMIGQHSMKRGSAGPPIRYNAVERCLDTLAGHAARLGASVHMPRIGCGLAGGKLELIEPIVTRTLSEHGIAVTVLSAPHELCTEPMSLSCRLKS